MSYTIQKSTLEFLTKLSQNNNKAWFTDNKEIYEIARENMILFSNALLSEMNKNDVIETPSGKKALKRIYRDVRFSKDKTPYKKHFGGALTRASATRRGGYYYHIEPNNNFVAGGFWNPNKEDLLHIRQQIVQDDSELRQIIESNDFKSTFKELLGEKLKTAPKGFDKEHPAIDLLRYKSFIIKYHFTDEEVLSKGFHEKMAEKLNDMRPFFDYMSDILSTNLNGESLY